MKKKLLNYSLTPVLSCFYSSKEIASVLTFTRVYFFKVQNVNILLPPLNKCLRSSALCLLQPRWLCPTSGGSGFAATAPGPSTRLPRKRPAPGASGTSWRRRTNRGSPAEARSPSRPPSRPCRSSSRRVRKATSTISDFLRKCGCPLNF